MNEKTNLTLGFISNYCFFPEVVLVNDGALVSNFTITREISLEALSSAAGNVYFNDITMMIAVQKYNENPNRMFNVDFKRFTDCGPYYYDAMDQYNGYSGGYAGSIMNNDIGNTYPDVIGVVGNEYSSTARYSAEGLSYYQIPYCSSGSVSPRLGDKQRYPYFFRAMPSRGLGNHIFQYLKTTSVTRVAMVYEKNDEMGSQFAIDIAQSMGQNGVQLICNIGLNTDFGLDELHYLKSQILQTDARYIIISGQNAFTASIYYGMASIGVYGTKYVYIGYNSPSLFDNQISQYQFNVYDAISGFIHFQQNQPDMTTELFADFYQRVLNASFLTPSDLDALTLIDNSNLGASPSFDCVMALMIGFENLVRKLGTDPNVLASRNLQQFLNFTQFKTTNYSGLDGILNFNEYGDLLTSYQISYYTGDYYNQTVFGHTNVDATNFTYIDNILPVYFGGSTTPPPDGPPRQLDRILFSLQKNQFGTVIFLGSSGLFLSFASFAFLFWFRRHPTVRSLGIDYSSMAVFGVTIGFCSVLAEISEPSPFLCNARVWMILLALHITLVPLIIKNVYVWIIFEATEDLDVVIISRRLYAFTVLSLLFEIALILAWSKLSNQQIELVQADDFYDVFVCRGNNNWATTTVTIMLYAHHTLWLLSIPLLSSKLRNVLPRYNEIAFLISIMIVLCLAIAIVETLPMNSDHNNDLRRCICVWVTGVITLALLLGSRVYELLRNKWRYERTRLQKETTGRRSSSNSRRSTSHRSSVQWEINRERRESTLPRKGVRKPDANLSNGYSFRQMSSVYIFKIQYRKYFKWMNYETKWMKTPIKLHEIRERMWLSLYCELGTKCYIILPHTKPVVTGANVKVPLHKISSKESAVLVFEFGGASEANEFVSEFDLHRNALLKDRTGSVTTK